MVPKKEVLKPLTQADRQELEAAAASDERLLKRISRSCLLVVVFMTLLTRVVFSTDTWEEYLMWFFIIATGATVLLVWIMRPLYHSMVRTKRDLHLGQKRTFVSIIEQKTRDKKEQWVDLITSNQEQLSIPVTEDEAYRVGDRVYVEQAPASKLPLRIEKVSPDGQE